MVEPWCFRNHFSEMGQNLRLFGYELRCGVRTNGRWLFIKKGVYTPCARGVWLAVEGMMAFISTGKTMNSSRFRELI